MSVIVNAPSPTGPAEDRHALTRTRRWMRYRREITGFLTDVMRIIAGECGTGRLTIHISQGAAAVAEFEEQVKIDKILGALAGESDELEPLIEEGNLISPLTVNQAAQKRREDLRRVSVGVDYLVRYLREHPCVDCGIVDTDVLEFDHVRGTKENNVTTLAYSGKPLDVIIIEIEKCEVRCANCHSKRHAIERRNDAALPHYKDHFLSKH